MNAATLLDKLNKTDEHLHLEGKSCSSGVGRSFYETVCAFANTEGGYVLVGVEKKGKEDGFLFPTYVPVGVENIDDVQQQIATACRCGMFNRQVTLRVTADEIDGLTVLVVYVPKANPGHRPIYFASEHLPSGAWIRVTSTDQRCTDDDLPALFECDRSKHDSETLEEATEADIDMAAVSQFRQLRSGADATADDHRYSDTEYLRGRRCIREVGGRLVPTVAGIALFGTASARRQFLPFSRIDYIRVSDLRWLNDAAAENYPEALPIEGPLIWMAIRATQEVLEDLPRQSLFERGTLQRKDVAILRERVAREVVINALMHRTYRTASAVKIIRYGNRIEIRNPGRSLLNSDLFGQQESLCRNETIAARLYEIKFAETKGYGIGIMRDKMSQLGLPWPVVISDPANDRFTAILLLRPYDAPEFLDWLSHFSQLKLSPNDHKALIVARELGAISTAAYRSVVQSDEVEASECLRTLSEHGLLLPKESHGTPLYYVPSPRMLNPAESSKGQHGSNRNPEGFGVPTPKGSGSGQRSLSRSVTVEELPDEFQHEIVTLGKRPPKKRMEVMILKLCAWRPLRPSALSVYLNRSQDYLRLTYVSDLLNREFLELIGGESNPYLVYKTTEKGMEFLRTFLTLDADE